MMPAIDSNSSNGQRQQRSPVSTQWNSSDSNGNNNANNNISGAMPIQIPHGRRSKGSSAERRRNRRSLGAGGAVHNHGSSPVSSPSPSIPSQISAMGGECPSEQRSSPQTSRKTNMRRVKFETNEVTMSATIPSRHSYTILQREALWISDKEHQQTIQRCKEIVRKMMSSRPDGNNNNPVDNTPLQEPRRPTRAFSFSRKPSAGAAAGDKANDANEGNDKDDEEEGDDASNTRGLEYMTPSGFDIITAKSKQTTKSVLDEQRRLRAEYKDKGGGSSSGINNTAEYEIFGRATNSVDDEIAEALARVLARVSRHRHRIAQLAAMRDAQAVYGTQCHRARLTSNATASAVSSTNPKDDNLRRSRSGGSLSYMVKEFNNAFSDGRNEPAEGGGVNWWKSGKSQSASNGTGNGDDSGSGNVNGSNGKSQRLSTTLVSTGMLNLNDGSAGSSAAVTSLRAEPQRGMLRPTNSFGSTSSATRRRDREPRRRRGPRKPALIDQFPKKVPSINEDSRRSSASTAASTISAASEATATSLAMA